MKYVIRFRDKIDGSVCYNRTAHDVDVILDNAKLYDGKCALDLAVTLLEHRPPGTTLNYDSKNDETDYLIEFVPLFQAIKEATLLEHNWP